MLDRLLVHIGTEKTGTTAIQSFLSQNRARLARSGIVYPRSIGTFNHERLAIHALDDESPVNLQGIFGVRTRQVVADFRRDIEQSLTTELADAPATCTTVLFSSEHLQSRLRKPGELFRLKSLLERFSADIRIIVYLRRQDRVANGAQSTRIVSGATDYESGDQKFESAAHSYYLRYDMMLENYANVFGKDSLDVRLYDERYKHSDGLIRDFARAIGLDDIPDAPDCNRLRNQSLSAPAQRFVARLNERVPVTSAAMLPARRAILAMLREKYPGTRPIFSRRTARRFMDLFAEPNEQIRRDYFASRPGPLFDDDYAEYPEELIDPDVDFTQSLDMACRILRASAAAGGPGKRRPQRRKAQIARLRAMLPPV